MIVKNIPYNPPSDYSFLGQKRKLKLVARIKKSITKFELKPDDFGFAYVSLSAAH
jgi:transposase